MQAGDKVTFTARIKNNSSVAIPNGANVGLKIVIDDATILTNNTFSEGLAANAYKDLTVDWTATAGGHTVVATAVPDGRLGAEANGGNNGYEKKINIQEGEETLDYKPVSGRYDIVVAKVDYINETAKNENRSDDRSIKVGDMLRFKATVVNAGDKDIEGGKKLGIEFQVNGNTSDITWCDTYYDGLKSHESVELICNGGQYDDDRKKGLWKAQNGSFSIMGWVDDTGVYGEKEESNNKKTIPLNIPYTYVGIQYWETPDLPDPLFGTVDVTINEKVGRSTLYYSNVNLLVPEGLEAYTIEVDKNGHITHTHTWKAGETIPADVAVVVEGPAGTYQFSVVLGDIEKPHVVNYLLGKDEGGYTTEASYAAKFYKLALNSQEKNPGFYYGATGGAAFAISGMHRAYLAVPTSVASAKLNYLFSDTATDIQGVEAVGESATYYDLQGRRVSAPNRPGLYIVNGRKLVVK